MSFLNVQHFDAAAGRMVLGHCVTKLDSTTNKFYCEKFNLLYLLRSREQATNFQTSSIDTSLIQGVYPACTGTYSFNIVINPSASEFTF